ncbi:MAG: hypothetical protein C0614_04405 [Desulfuromonas sp.]|nr:MAG: hypothetical protein C0614_04405 [Desulfuromonas sp.]
MNFDKGLRAIRHLLVIASVLLMSSCMTIGWEFPVHNVARIEIGKTSRSDIHDMFGPPWRTGIEDGRKVWTYAHYKYGLSGQTEARDLLVRFDDAGLVFSYTFSSSVPGEGDF